MSTVQGWKKEDTGVQGWVEVVVEEGGAGWIWVPPTPPPTLKSSPGRPPKPAAPPNLSCAATNTGKQSQGQEERGYESLG